MSLRFLSCVLLGFLIPCLLAVADSARVPDAKTVTIQAAQIRLPQALAELTRQTGIRVEDRRGSDPELHLDLKGRTFWQALDAIAAAADARVYLSPRAGRISLVRRLGGMTPPTSYSGPFRLGLTRLLVSRDFDSTSRHTTANLEVCWEPDLQPFLLETRPQKLVVKDEAGNVVPWLGQGSSVAPVDGRIALQFDIALPAFPRSAQRIGLLEGELSAIGPSKMLHFSFDTLDALDRAPPGGALRFQTREGISCNITRMTLAPDRWTIQVTLDAPLGVKLESFQSWVVNNEMVLVDPKDDARRFPSSDYVLESASERRAVISYNFRDKEGLSRGKPEDWKLLYTTPASVVVIPIPFQFKDVPLP